MKFLILGPVKSENTQEIVAEIEGKGHEAFIVSPKDFIFSIGSQGMSVHAKGKDLFEYDVFILRGYNITLTETRIFVEALLYLGKTVIDETVGSDFIPSKLYEASKLSRVGLEYPKSFLLTKNKKVDQVIDKLNFPVIVKPIYGQKGQGVQKIGSKKDLEDLMRESDEKFLIQEFLEIDGDVRVFVVNGEVLGAMKRFVLEGDFRSNTSLGARTEEFPLGSEVKKVALKAVKAMNYEIAGVDLAWTNNKWYVIEVNSTPQWQEFKETTGINPAEKIVEYAMNKYNKKNEL